MSQSPERPAGEADSGSRSVEAVLAVPRRRRRGSRRPSAVAAATASAEGFGKAFVIAALVLLAVIFVYPFIWLVSASFKPRGEVFDNTADPRRPSPSTTTCRCGRRLRSALWLLNTADRDGARRRDGDRLVCDGRRGGSRYFRFRGEAPSSDWCSASMMLPGAVTMIPTFLIWNSLGHGRNTRSRCGRGNLFGSAFYVFLLRQFMLGLPRDLFEAARVDGATQWGVFWRVALPLTEARTRRDARRSRCRRCWTDLMRAADLPAGLGAPSRSRGG